MSYNPIFQINPLISKALAVIEANKALVKDLPVTPKALASLRETAKLFTTHYSTAIEGNKLDEKQIVKVIKTKIKPRQRDEREVLGYYAALEKAQEMADKNILITENIIKTIHGIIMSAGNIKAKPTSYRDGQNVIKDSRSGLIVYMPPIAKDVIILMKELVEWINKETSVKELPIPIIAAIIHYQFATIHPYYDGNGRTARLLTSLFLQLNDYGLKGIYCLEEYYARNLAAYYRALSIGEHNYYMGRAKSDISSFIEYFCIGMADSFEKVRITLQNQAPTMIIEDQSKLLRELDNRQKRALDLFIKQKIITTKDVALTLGLSLRAANNICTKWQDSGFIKATSQAKKNRGYILAAKWRKLVE